MSAASPLPKIEDVRADLFVVEQAVRAAQATIDDGEIAHGTLALVSAKILAVIDNLEQCGVEG